MDDVSAEVSVFTDIPYYPPESTDQRDLGTATKGSLGAFEVAANSLQAGQGSQRIGIQSDKNNEYFWVGDQQNPNTVLGQLRSKTGIDEYGLWTNNGYFSGTVTASNFIGGAIHIPNLDINTNSFHTDSTGLSWWGATNTNKAIAPVRINPNGEMTLGNPAGVHLQFSGPNKRIRSSDYSAGVSGFYIDASLMESENIRARGMLLGATFKYDAISAVGGQLLCANADTLEVDMTAADNSLLTITGASSFVANDVLLIRAIATSGIEEEYMQVLVAAGTSYSLIRDLAATYAANSNPVWKKGTTVVKVGKSDGATTYSGGWLRLLGEGTNAPHYSVFARTGIAYNAYSERVRLGNLNGIGGFVADTYGAFMGSISSGYYFSYDDVSGLLVVNGRQFTSDPVFGDGSDGDMTIAAGTTTLTSDIFPSNLTINGTLVLNGYRYFVKNTLTVNNGGIIDCSGNVGSNGGNGSTGGVGGTAGTGSAGLASGSIYGSIAGGDGGKGGVAGASIAPNAPAEGVAGGNQTSSLGVAGSAGGQGGVGTTGPKAGGAGGTVTAAKASVRNMQNALTMYDTSASTLYKGSAGSGGGGGGSGYNNNTANDGSGGGGGGAGSAGGLMMGSARIIIINAGGIIRALGGAGGNGGNGGNGVGAGGAGSGGGGAGGGSGGVIILIYTSLTNNGTISVAGGAAGVKGVKGTGGVGGGADGVDGTAGLTGVYIPLQLV